MSFSSQIKEELDKVNLSARHCQLAELAALYRFCVKNEENKITGLSFSSDNELAVRKAYALLRKTFNLYKDSSWDDSVYDKKGSTFKLTIEDMELSNKISKALSQDNLLVKNCCKRAFIRGAFLAIGSVSDPEKSYHLEFVCKDESEANYIAKQLEEFSIDAKVILRKKYYVLYVKDGTSIVDTLNVMGAHIAMMELENTRILKEVRNSVNRKMNCELANIGKTVSASQKQIDDINKLMKFPKIYGNLPQNLQEMAELRIQNPEASLKELGELSSPPLGKSGVNHRLRKLCEIADAIE